MKNILALALILVSSCCRADCVVEFTAPTRCAPCRQMEPIVSELKRSGFDIRVVDVDDEKNKKLVEGYGVPSLPYFVFVYETPTGWKRGGFIKGVCTAGQLRRLAVAPRVTTIGAATRGAVRDVCEVLEW